MAALGESEVRALLSVPSADFYANEEALRRAVRGRSRANLIHQATQPKVGIFVAGGAPFGEQQLRWGQAVEIAPGRTFHVHPPEGGRGVTRASTLKLNLVPVRGFAKGWTVTFHGIAA